MLRLRLWLRLQLAVSFAQRRKANAADGFLKHWAELFVYEDAFAAIKRLAAASSVETAL